MNRAKIMLAIVRWRGMSLHTSVREEANYCLLSETLRPPPLSQKFNYKFNFLS